jgi:hypothetical protein
MVATPPNCCSSAENKKGNSEAHIYFVCEGQLSKIKREGFSKINFAREKMHLASHAVRLEQGIASDGLTKQRNIRHLCKKQNS